jgi:hypothetical protein
MPFVRHRSFMSGFDPTKGPAIRRRGRTDSHDSQSNSVHQFETIGAATAALRIGKRRAATQSLYSGHEINKLRGSMAREYRAEMKDERILDEN